MSKFYFTGVPCRNGHIAPRRIKKGTCLDCERNKPRAYLVTNREERLQKQRAYNIKFYRATAQEQVARVRQYKIENKGLATANERRRQAAKLKRTPAWADNEAIKQFYKDCPLGMTVDHTIPLQGLKVSGLHVHNNLQYLTRSDNSKKLNRYEVL